MIHPLHSYIGYRILQMHKTHRNHAEVALKELGLYTGQEMVLFLLWRQEGLTQSQLAEILCVEAPTVTKSLQRLAQSGLIEKRHDVEDGRISRVYLTARGRALETPVQNIWDDLEALTIQGLSEAELASLHRILDQMSDNIAK